MANNQQLLLGEGAGGGLPNFIEEVFSTYLYTGNGSTQTITNGIDLDTKGGMVWAKVRSTTGSNIVRDSARGPNNALVTDATFAQGGGYATTFTSTGYTDGTLTTNGATFVSWTFRKQPKFFDVVAYTGTGSNTTIVHNLGSVPGCIIVKRTDTTGDWQVYHRANTANPETDYLVLNDTAATADSNTRWNDTLPTDSVFSLGTEATVNASGGTYVAYLFAHDAGGFGLSGTDNVISCGSFTTDGSGNATVNLGWEPQFAITKASSNADSWWMWDTMREWNVGGAKRLLAESSDAESATITAYKINNQGFSVTGVGAGRTYIYIAIRRGPMKVPTSGTSVLGLSARSGTGANATVSGGQLADAALIKNRGSAVGDLFAARLTGTGYLETSSTAAEVAAGTTVLQANPWDVMDGVKVGTSSTITNASGSTFINYLFRRAPGFFDVVCYTGTAPTAQNLTHNLGVAPEFIIIKRRDAVGSWFTGSMFTSTTVTRAVLNANNDQDLNSLYSGQSIFGGQPTASVFSVGTGSGANASGGTYVAYLFATCAGVSKVGTYTGTAAAQVINCGFTSGARFVLIKRTDSTGDWYVWDSARGIIAGDDPYLLLNSTAAEVTNTDYVDTDTTGFELSSTAPAAINASGGTFIFLAIA